MKIASFFYGAVMALLATTTAVQAQPANRPYWVTGYSELTQALQYHRARSRADVWRAARHSRLSPCEKAKRSRAARWWRSGR